MKPPIDIDDSTSWPTDVYRIVAEWAEECAGRTEYTSGLPLRIELEAPFRERLAGQLVLAYHYTRLIPPERQMIRERGLRMLSVDLLTERIESARAIGAISSAEAKTFQRAHVFAMGEEKHREGQVCLVLSKRQFERDLDACLPLLSSWGGEGLYRSSGSVPFRSRLKDIGAPTRVSALLSLEDARRDSVFPVLHKIFVASLLDLHDVGGEVFYRSAIPPEHIVGVENVDFG
jgi:hypothetical protein